MLDLPNDFVQIFRSFWLKLGPSLQIDENSLQAQLSQQLFDILDEDKDGVSPMSSNPTSVLMIFLL